MASVPEESRRDGGREGEGRKFMSMRPDDPETGEAQAHKNALCTPLTTPHFYPSLFLSLILSLSLSLYLPPSLRSLSLMQAVEVSQLSDVLGGCVQLPEVTAAIFS